MKGRSDWSRGWKADKAPGKALPASLQFSLSHAPKKQRQSDQARSWTWAAAQQRADQESYQARTLIRREVSLSVWVAWAEAKAFGTEVNASPYLSLRKGPPGQLGIPILKPWRSAVFGGVWGERWVQPLEEKCVCTCMPQGADYSLWGAGTEGAPVIEFSGLFFEHHWIETMWRLGWAGAQIINEDGY